MSKDIIIQKNGVDQTLTGIEKLRTPKSGGGTCDWIPEDEAKGGVLYTNKNGTYAASAANLRGFTKAVVRVASNQVSGIGADGNIHSIGVDDLGNLTDEMLPSEIRVTTIPNKTLYSYGATMDYTGLVVTAYDALGNVWTGDGEYPDGIIPLEELILPVETAEAESGADSIMSWSTSDLDTSKYEKPIISTQYITGYAKWKHAGVIFEKKTITMATDARLWFAGGVDGETTGPAIFICSKTPHAAALFQQWRIGYDDYYHSEILYTPDNPTMVNGQPVYWSAGQYGGLFNIGPYESTDENIVPPHFSLEFTGVDGSDNRNYANACYTVLYGETEQITGGKQIPVQWMRPGDNELLETSFGVSVAPDYRPQAVGSEAVYF